MRAQVVLAAPTRQFEADLAGWGEFVRDLRAAGLGRLRREAVPTGPGEKGAAEYFVLTVTSVAAIRELARLVETWITTRSRSAQREVALTVRGPSGDVAFEGTVTEAALDQLPKLAAAAESLFRPPT